MSVTSGIRPWPVAYWLGAGVLPGGLAAVALLVLSIRHVVIRTVDPNRGFPDRPAAYPGAPVGHKVEAAGGRRATQPRSVQAGAAVGAYPVPPPRALKASSKTLRRAPGAE